MKTRLNAVVFDNLKVLSEMLQAGNSSNRGQGLVEYALIMSLIVLVGMVGLALFGTGEQALFGRILGAWPH